MREIIKIGIAFFLFINIAIVNIFAAEYCHYVNGSEGIKQASIPPPGIYYRIYTLFYHSEELTGDKAKTVSVGYDAKAYLIFHRYFWVAEKKFFGGNYVFNIIIPLIYQKVRIHEWGVNDSVMGLSDILLEPFILAWHGKRWDAVFGLGCFAPTGKYDKNKLASIGRDFWTGEVGLGGTYYFDEKKTWSFSTIARREWHSRKQEERITPGNDFHFEWGFGKTLVGKYIWDVGACGYCQWQVTDDRGRDVTYDRGMHDRVIAAGPEIMFTIPSLGINYDLKGLFQFCAKDRPEGYLVNLAILKKF